MPNFRHLHIRLSCTVCRQEFDQPDTGQDIICPGCSACFPMMEGIPSFLPHGYATFWQKKFEQNAASGDMSAQSVGYIASRHQIAMRNACRVLLGEPLMYKTILDVGCGHGGFSSFLTRENRVIGVDYALEMLKLARFNGLEVYHAEATVLPFAANQFDLAISILVIQSVENPALWLAEMARTLVSNGLLVVSFPNAGSLARKIYRRVHTWLPYLKMDMPLPTLYSWRQLREMVSDLPLRIDKMGVLFFPLSMYTVSDRIRSFDHFMASNFILRMRKITAAG